MSEEGHTDVVSATHLAISEPPSVASEECSTVAGTPIVNRCSAAGWSIYYQHLFLESRGAGRTLKRFMKLSTPPISSPTSFIKLLY